ncbi:peptidoglycan DD-metalloendopeptidase family protein [Brevibacillus agri]|uniref:murein hydrolase activator EnvC family protein n=1 Tax=Brevibacillus TaxID=55080 RepID=UPI00203D8ED4|nr:MULTISPECIES: M23 family metallopeptidase [Brevibacillus]MCM3081999.1 peptidoglycan DD-metalloendopeptidase family protein [Brevibacillus invocatus]MCM3432394.1 peptidoglycan DD-metalloendopeptidase family protein [Brevibacillus invocatus]MED1645732.1 peptidoglycan DD-metalloendopeptidase family protein [Brevibacillus agri]MED1652763.1 peptidoglycan DD-metalloendopeptidase family protein [Brevibacillus agri]MED1689541.1 peptidoglycan DD-metalloendopeptidase family protein [Brevibacillus agr
MKTNIAVFSLLAGLITWSAFPTPYTWAQQESATSIQKQLDEIRSQKRKKAQSMKGIDSEIESINKQEKQLNQDLMVIDLKRNEIQRKIDQLEQQIDVKRGQMISTQEELSEISLRLAERESILRARVKVLYEQGNTTYLDLLLGSKNFGEFLIRLENIQMIVNQDNQILEEHQKDKDLLTKKEISIKNSMDSVKLLMDESETFKMTLDQQYQKSLVLQAALKEKQDKLTEIKDEEEQALKELMAVEAKKIAETKKIKRPSPPTPSKSTMKSFRGGELFLPLPSNSYRQTSAFGLRTDPFTGKSAGHNGLDLAAPKGTAIYAAEDGVVTIASYMGGYGNAIVIKHNDVISTLYAHIREGGLMVESGQEVKRGQKIAEVGSTGRSTGNHLHFTVYKNDNAVDPNEYLN